MARADHLPSIRQGDTRENLISATRRLIQTRSYLGFSFQDLADVVGLRKASLYHHFPTKEALGVSVLQDTLRAFEDWTNSETRTPHEWLDAYFDMYRNTIRAGERVCPGGSFVAGWDCIDDALRHAVRDIRRAQITWLGGILGSLPIGDRKPDALASFVFATCQGALATARMTGRVDDFDALISQLNDMILH